MVESKNLKLKLGLCGLALTSFLAINAHSTVHADTVNSGNANAITWDSDQDDSQVVKEEPQQDNSSQSVQKQVAVQSNVQVKQSQPKVAVANVSSTPVQQNRAEKSNLCQSNVQTSTVDRLNANTARLQVKIARLNDAVPANRVVINNPQNNQVIVHYIKSNGQSANLADQTIDVTKTGQGSYQVPSGYNVNNPDGKYTVSGGAFNGTNLKGNTWTVPAQYTNKLTTGFNNIDKILQSHDLLKDGNSVHAWVGDAVDVSYDGLTPDEGLSIGVNTQARIPQFYNNYYYIHLNDKDMASLGKTNHWFLAKKYHGTHGTGGNSFYLDPNVPDLSSFSDVELDDICNTLAEHTQSGIYNQTSSVYVDQKDVEMQAAYTMQHLPVAFVDSNNNIVGMVQNYTGRTGTTQNVNLTLPTGYKLADGQSLPTTVTFQNNTNPLLIKVKANPNVADGTTGYFGNNIIRAKFVDQLTGKLVGSSDIDRSKLDFRTYTYVIPSGYAALHNTFELTPGDNGELEGGYNKFVDFYNPISPSINNEPVTVTVPVHKTNIFSFTDNSGNVQSVVGNAVNVVVTKPQSVDPNSAQCKKQATRVIHVAFPNGVKPKSYDSITDSAGNKLTLDSNNDLTQTVTFTRSVTVDSLTGATLNQTPWQQHGAINTVTLPSIPGYTMVTNN